MKISAIQTHVVRIPYTTGGPSQPEPWGGRPWLTADALLVRVDTDEGVTGWGEAFGYNAIPATRVAIDEILAPLYLGRDALAAAELLVEAQQKLHIFGRGGPLIYAMSGLDIALWDIAGKVAREPLWRMLGGSGKPVACYASLIRYSNPALVAANVERALGQGYRHVKLHEIELPAIRAARDAAGPEVGLMLDVNCPWTLQEALAAAEQLKPLQPYWLEEPVWPPEDFAALAQVRRQSRIAIAAGENAATLTQFQQMFGAGAVDVAQPSPTKCGGVTELVKIFTAAAFHGVQVVPHSFYDGPGFLAGLHVNAALGGAQALAEWRFFDLEASLYGQAGRPRNGSMALPLGPGLGLDPDPEVIRRYAA
jgi:L-alanine-DL-glutamate epimerase-like enolase superfamily enzyme